MKAIRFILSFFFFVLITNSHAQYLTYDLSEYKLPDIKTNLLDLKVDVTNQLYSNFYEAADRLEGVNMFRGKNQSNDFAGDLDLKYKNFRNSAEYQGIQAFQIRLQPALDFHKAIEETRTKLMNGDVSFISNNRFYNQSKLFFESDLNVFYQLYSRKSRNQDTKEELLQANKVLGFSLPLSVGFGRIEPVENARLAVYIIESLTKQGKIINQPSEALITELAREISRIKRKRFLDTRIRKIEEMQAIDSFLLTNSIVSSNDIRYFTALNDQWDYASGPERKTGFSINGGFFNDIRLSTIAQTDPIEEGGVTVYPTKKALTNVYTAGLFVRIDKSKPLNLYWQSDFYSKTSYDIEFTRSPTYKDIATENFDTKIFTTAINYSLRFLPDSRTSIGITVGGNYQNSGGIRTATGVSGPAEGWMNSNVINFNTGLNINYYFSPRMRLDCYYNLNSFNDRRSTKIRSTYDVDFRQDTFSNGFGMFFTYSFF